MFSLSFILDPTTYRNDSKVWDRQVRALSADSHSGEHSDKGLHFFSSPEPKAHKVSL